VNWYYAEGTAQKGPVSDQDFQQLVSGGAITDSTLVWREGMANWIPYAQARGMAVGTASVAGGGAAAAGGATVVCAECNGMFPADEVIRYGDRAVCAACKPAFVQKLKEGAVLGGAIEYAGFWLRFGAKILDGIILWVVGMGVGFAVTFALGAGGEGPNQMFAAQLVAGGINIVISLAYGTFFLGKFGATPGKMACKIRVVTPEGDSISYGRALGRCASEILSQLICYIGYLMAAWDDEKRTLHDRIAGTRVIKVG
jgi:uncharacterized RDD family membrane protein YckC